MEILIIRAVKFIEAFRNIFNSMGMDYVNYHSDSQFMRLVHKNFKLFRCAKPT